jgi:transposase
MPAPTMPPSTMPSPSVIASPHDRRRRRERLRQLAAQMFAGGSSPPAVASRLGVSARTAYRWRQAWETGGQRALLSKGAPGPPQRLSPTQMRRLDVTLAAGPAAAGYAADPRWTLARVRDLIDTMFGQRFSLEGVSQVLHRLDWSPAQRNGAVMRSGQGSRTGWSPRGGERSTIPHA